MGLWLEMTKRRAAGMNLDRVLCETDLILEPGLSERRCLSCETCSCLSRSCVSSRRRGSFVCGQGARPYARLVVGNRPCYLG